MEYKSLNPWWQLKPVKLSKSGMSLYLEATYGSLFKTLLRQFFNLIKVKPNLKKQMHLELRNPPKQFMKNNLVKPSKTTISRFRRRQKKFQMSFTYKTLKTNKGSFNLTTKETIKTQKLNSNRQTIDLLILWDFSLVFYQLMTSLTHENSNINIKKIEEVKKSCLKGFYFVQKAVFSSILQDFQSFKGSLFSMRWPKVIINRRKNRQ